MDIKRGPALAAIILSGLVGVAVLLQAFSITAFIRSGDTAALDMHKGIGDATLALEVLTLIAVIVAAKSNPKVLGMSTILVVVGVLQYFAIGNVDKQGGWISGLHGLLAVVIMVLAVELTHTLSRARRGADTGTGSAA